MNINWEAETKNILIVAKDYNEFMAFCYDKTQEFNKYGYWQGYIFHYYSMPDSIRGMLFDDYWLIGKWWKRKHIDLILINSCLKENRQ